MRRESMALLFERAMTSHRRLRLSGLFLLPATSVVPAFAGQSTRPRIHPEDLVTFLVSDKTGTSSKTTASVISTDAYEVVLRVELEKLYESAARLPLSLSNTPFSRLSVRAERILDSGAATETRLQLKIRDVNPAMFFG